MKRVDYILDANCQSATGGRKYIVFKAFGEQPRALKLHHFDKKANSLCAKFQAEESEESFCRVFSLLIKPYFDQKSGIYLPAQQTDSTIQEEHSLSHNPNTNHSTSTPRQSHHNPTSTPSQSPRQSHNPTSTPSQSHNPTSTPRQSHNPTSTPSQSHNPTSTPSQSHQHSQDTSFSGRDQTHAPVTSHTTPQTGQKGRGKKRRLLSDSEKQPNQEDFIKDCYVGQFTLPISCMIEPRSSRLVRPVDRAFVHCLKQEMVLNPTTDVAPFIGHLRLREDEEFDPLHPEAYTYETLGGNNSRVALMEIVEENPSLASNPCYSKHLVSVYRHLTAEQAQLLGVKHNRQQTFVHQTTTQDKVHLCRIKLYTSAGKDVDLDETPEGTTKWRDDCAATLMTTKLKLTDNMILSLASLPKRTYDVLLKIYNEFEQKGSNSRQALKAKSDCRGSLFRELRNLDKDTIHDILVKVEEGDLKLTELNRDSKRLKKMNKLKQRFTDEVGLKDWQEAVELYPTYASEVALEKFVASNSLSAASMEAFENYCRKAVSSSQEPSGSTTLVEIARNDVYCALQMPISPEQLSYQGVVSQIPGGFNGFSVCVAHFSTPSDQQVKSVLRAIRAINRGAGLSSYLVVLFGLNAKALLADEGLHVEVVYWHKQNSSVPRRGLFCDDVVPIFIGVSKVDVVISQVANDKLSRIVTGEFGDAIQYICDNLSSDGDWILECYPPTREYYMENKIRMYTLDKMDTYIYGLTTSFNESVLPFSKLSTSY